MAQQNQVSFSVSDTDLADIKAAIRVLQTKLLPHLITLTAQERQELPKMGDKTVAFVQKSLEGAQKNKDITPAFLDVAALLADIQAVQVIRDLAQDLVPLTDALIDTMTLSGSEANQGGLVFYNAAKAAAKVKVPNAQAIYDDLSARFPGANPKRQGTAMA